MKKSFLVSMIVATLLSCHGDCDKPSNCNLAPEAGLCLAAFTRYYYDKGEGKCKEFTWGGCGGVVPFNTMEECRQCECN